MFSLFRQRGPKGFELATRYYDPKKEERAERLKKLKREADAETLRAEDRRLFAERMQHSWRRQSSDRTHIVRLVLIMGMVIAILYFIVKAFGLLAYWDA
jgi:Flp pilus assembly protein TadB